MRRTTLIGLDGLTYRILDPLMESGVMPFTREFVARGVRAGLRSTRNPMTMQAWPTIMTGYEPGRHGVLDFVRMEERDGEMYLTLYDARDLRCDTIWSIASRNGLKSVSLNFPVMYPHPEIDGYIVPGMTSWRHLKLGVQPAALYEDLKNLNGLEFKELAWDFEQGKKVVDGIPPEQYESWVEFHIKREHHWFSIARHLMQKDPCALTAVLFDGPDKLFHICWQFLDPDYVPVEPTAWQRHIRELCLEYFRRIDTYIEELVTLSGDDATILMVSDHGFGPSHDTFHINVWLEDEGLLAWRSPESMRDRGDGAWSRRIKSNVALLDWSHTKVYAATSSSNGLYIRVSSGSDDSGVSAAEYYSFRAKLIDKLYSVRHPITGRPFVTRVWTKEEAFGSDLPDAPDLLLQLHDYGFISIKNMRPVIECNSEVNGTHHPIGIFLARGPGMKEGAVFNEFAITDVAPAMLYGLGLEIPADFPGRVRAECYEPEWLRDHPVRAESPMASQPKRMAAGAAVAHSELEDNEQLLKRLQDLGYL